MNVDKNKKSLPLGKTEDGLQYDIAEPNIGHFNRFQAKLATQKKTKIKNNNWYRHIAIAASLLLLFTFGIGVANISKGFDLADVSPKMEETQDYYTQVIHQELEKIIKVKNNKNKKIIDDALLQLTMLEKNYNKQKLELSNNLENKNVIFAMINNYQQRIEVLQNLLSNLDKFNNITNNYNETNTL